MKATIIDYTLSKCQKCLTCLKSCPTQAISLVNDRVEINNDRCIACDQCIKACTSAGLKNKSSDLKYLKDYDYNVLLLPTAIYSDCGQEQEAASLLKILKDFGFDEVIDISDISGAMYQESIKYVDKYNDKCRITSFCPVINHLIEVKYPMLMDMLLPFDYPLEVAAKRVRKRLSNKDQTIGIFSLCECVGNLTLAKHPYGNSESNIDHALSIAELFPKIFAKMREESKVEQPATISICREGLCSIISDYYKEKQGKEDLLAITGFEKVERVLELAEFDNLHSIRLLSLYACASGCIGGHFLWGNPFVGRIHMERFLKLADKPCADLSFEEIYKEHNELLSETKISMKEKLQYFQKVNKVLEDLPGYDCGACGLASCRMMSEEIIEGRRSIKDCAVLKGEVKNK
ncbi:MAG: [Fe-Fe] hydrogenase large subunit C-terminal domain-containing protein [Erysipelotrichaceae bacterium]